MTFWIFLSVLAFAVGLWSRISRRPLFCRRLAFLAKSNFCPGLIVLLRQFLPVQRYMNLGVCSSIISLVLGSSPFSDFELMNPSK